MKVSIVVPIYKVEEYLEECLDSIINQSFDDYEVICIDDDSPDNCHKILEHYSREYEKIRVIKNDRNLGLSRTRNKGLNIARGKYIWFIDSDDYIKPGALEELYKIAETKSVDIIYFNKEYFIDSNYKGTYIPYEEIVFGNEEIITGREMITKYLLAHSYKSMNAYTQFFRLDFLQSNNLYFYDGIVHEDYLFYFFCAMKAKRVTNLDKELYCYRLRDNSITSKLTPLRKQSMVITFSEVLYYWKNNLFNERENQAMEVLCDDLFNICFLYSKSIPGISTFSFSDVAAKYLYERFFYNSYLTIDKDEWADIENATRIWIYGAGKVARELVPILEDKKISIEGIITTTSDGNGSLFGWPIKCINAIEIRKKDLVLVASAGVYRNEMVRILQKIGHNNYVCVSKLDI